MEEMVGTKIGQVLKSNVYLFPNNITIVEVKAIFHATKPLKTSIHIGSKIMVLIGLIFVMRSYLCSVLIMVLLGTMRNFVY